MNIDTVKRAADAYLETAEGSAAERLRFLKGVWRIQSEIGSAERPYEAPSTETTRATLLAGQPLFLASPPPLPLDEYVDAVTRIASLVADTAGLPDGPAEALRSADFAAAVTEKRLTAAAGTPDAFAAAVSNALGAAPDAALTPATVAFVLVSALVPFLAPPAEAALETAGGVDRGTWSSGECPVCGSAATMGRMGESTQLQGAERTLWCGLCHTEWGYDRIRCVRCGTRSPDSLHYGHLESDPAHRLHLCDECHGYAKFVFTDDLDKPLSMLVEEAITTTLDAMAHSQGYTSTGDGGKSADEA